MLYTDAFSKETLDRLHRDLEVILRDPVIPVPGLGVFAFEKGKLAAEDALGVRRYPSGDAPALPFTETTRFRTASISKVFSALAVMRLVEKGKLSLDRDVSEYLGFSLRNPHYPDDAITLRMLMSHTSSLRDGCVYSIPPEDSIEELFTEGGKYYRNAEGATDHFANGEDGIDRRPGRYFSYTNLNYGVIGTIFERISGQRFDEFMRSEVLLPLGMNASFNVGDFSPEELADLSPLYQPGKDGLPASQIDDYAMTLPSRQQVLITNPDLGGENVLADLADYRIGANGTLFSPQGGLRICMKELEKLMDMLLHDGVADGRQFLQKPSIDTMFAPYWDYDPALKNGDTYGDLMTSYGPGIQTMTARYKDRFVRDRNIVMSGHFGEAYGLLAGIFMDRAKGRGIFYVINGQGAPYDEHYGDYSGMYQWEEHLCTAILDNLFPDRQS